MELTLQKTITFLLFIFIGILLKFKFKSDDEVSGIKKIILNLALPATIFIALLGVEIDLSLLTLPFFALGLNFILFFGFPFVLPFLGIYKNTPKYRTVRLLAPSLAPGLSCFPFILEFLGKPFLAKAAMADLGNKVFVLIILYVIAVNWYFQIRPNTNQGDASKMKSLLKSMISEPVNIFILVAISLVSFGFSLESLPVFIIDALRRLSLLMTPLVLLFIGLAVRIKRNQLLQIVSILLLRAGFVVLICAIFIFINHITVHYDILLILAFGLSACSFWPFAHISSIERKESNIKETEKTFSSSFAIGILALSFPLSTFLILGVLSSGTLLTNATSIFLLAAILILLGGMLIFSQHISKIREFYSQKKSIKSKYKVNSTKSIYEYQD